jgi:hypothetical protein
MSRSVLFAVILAASAAGGCSSREVLQPKSAAVPAGIDFSGRWQLHADSADSVGRISEAERRSAGAGEAIRVSPKRSRDSKGTLVHVFLETGEVLKVSQTDYGLFISFDRAVVEEYRFGENREISVGPVVADRVSGWEGRAYVVETLDEDGAKLTETWSLADRGGTLLRRIVIGKGDVRELDVEQRFERRQ